MKRLDAVCSLIVRAGVIADVGCDHGKVAEYCVKNSLADRVIASDISAVCLEKARARLDGFDNVEFVLCDGLRYRCDEAVIAGVGGMLTVKMLSEAVELPKTLVLCPHRNVDGVRSALIELGYTIDKDFMCKERGKFYSVMRAERREGETQRLDRLQILFGVNYASDRETVTEYLDRLYNTYMLAPTENAEMLECIDAAKKNTANNQ